MSYRNRVGIDNGVSGSWGIIYADEERPSLFMKAPIKRCRGYQKAKAYLNRIDFVEATRILSELSPQNTIVVLERPMVNNSRWTATISAIRALETTLCVLESLRLPIMYIDSKEWQKSLLPPGTKGDDLKTESLAVACRLFPEHESLLKKHKDGDGILIAEYARRKNF